MSRTSATQAGSNRSKRSTQKDSQIPNFAGYLSIHVRVENFNPGPRWVVIEEQLDETPILTNDRQVLLERLRKTHTVQGVVVKCGSEARHRYGIEPGDEVAYEQWQGGRWAFEDPTREDGCRRVLVMDCSYLRARIVPQPETIAAG